MKNLKITLHLATAVSIQKNKGAFDSILAVLYFNDLKNKGEFNGDYTQDLPFLQKSECGVYHTSFGVFDGVKYYEKEALIKTFDHDMYARFGVIKQQNGVPVGIKNTQTGKLKNALYDHEKFGMDKVTYYVRGDLEKIKLLLTKLRYLGKKTSLGWGKIDKIAIEETDRDLSIIKGGQLMRNLPVKNSFGISGDKVGLFRLMHPYWKKEELQECILP